MLYAKNKYMKLGIFVGLIVQTVVLIPMEEETIETRMGFDPLLRLTLVSLLPNTPPAKIPDFFDKMYTKKQRTCIKALDILTGCSLSQSSVDNDVWRCIYSYFGSEKRELERFGNFFLIERSENLIPDEGSEQWIKDQMHDVAQGCTENCDKICIIDEYAWDNRTQSLAFTTGDIQNPLILGSFPVRNNTVKLDFVTKKMMGSVEVLPGAVHIFNREEMDGTVVPVWQQTINVTPLHALSGNAFAQFASLPQHMAIIPVADITNDNTLQTFHIHGGGPSFIHQVYRLNNYSQTLSLRAWLAHRLAYMVKRENARVCFEAFDLYWKDYRKLCYDSSIQYKLYQLAGELSMIQNHLLHKILTLRARTGSDNVQLTYAENAQLNRMPDDVHALLGTLNISLSRRPGKFDVILLERSDNSSSSSCLIS
jgi:hypothetical protein